MNDTSLAPAVDDPTLTADTDRALFYVVSTRKFAILFIATLGLYAFYWFYRNWDQYRDNSPYTAESGKTIWPFPRAVFSIFFIHSLFRKVKESAAANPKIAQWSNTAHAWLLVVLICVSNALDRLSSREIGSPGTDLLSLAILVPMLFSFMKAQDMINASCNDPDGKTNSRLTTANYVWIVLGVLIWILACVGIFMPGGSEGFSASSSGGF